MLENYLAVAPYFGWDLVRDVQELLRYAFMQHAYEAGTIVALSAGIIGYFVVLRGLSFAAHALSHIGFAGATGLPPCRPLRAGLYRTRAPRVDAYAVKP